ncbi:MAG TPA: hypothetical protein VIL46_06085 [Gemmataceae bacterium]
MRILQVPGGGFRCFAFSPDGRWLATGHEGGALRLWDPRAGAVAAVSESRSRGLLHVAVSPDGTRVAARGAYELLLWEIRPSPGGVELCPSWRGWRWFPPGGFPGWEARTIPDVGSEKCLSFSPDGRALIFPSADPSHPGVCVLPLDGEALFTRPIARGEWIQDAAFHPDGRTLAVASDHRASLWDWEPSPGPAGGRAGEACRATFAHPDHVTRLCFSGDGRRLATLAGRTLRVWDVEARECVREITPSRKAITAAALSPDGRLAATAFVNHKDLRLWDVETGRERARFAFSVGAIPHLAFSPDGLTAAAGGSARKLVVWDVDAG